MATEENLVQPTVSSEIIKLLNWSVLNTQPLVPLSLPTVFLDRDGVINRNRSNHVLSWDDFTFEDGALEALSLLNKAGFQSIVITNQAAVDRGLIEVQKLEALHSRMAEEIEKQGGWIKAVLYCPHHPEVYCSCRKPRPGLIFSAATRFGIELSRSWLIGDYLTDLEAGWAAGCKTILVQTGRGSDALEILCDKHKIMKYPNYQSEIVIEKEVENKTLHLVIKRNLFEAVKYILEIERVAI